MKQETSRNIRKLSVKDIVANIDKKHMWKGNILQKLAEESVKYAIPAEEIMKIDLSVKLLKELEREIKNKEIISIQINAKPRMAKSTLGILLGKFIFDVLKKYKMKPSTARFGMKNIARDQNEKIKKMRDPDLMYDVIVTDESNALEETGENATVERAQREVFSDVQAGRYVHGVWICPSGTMDKNSDILIEIRNKDEGLIHTRISYFMRSQLHYGWVMIGVADFNVKRLIRNWLDVEDKFFDYLKSGKEEDKKFIDKWRRKDFYIDYMVRKYEKMELMNREGILHARDLDYAEIRMKVVESLKPLAQLTVFSIQRLRNNIKSKIESEFKKKRMPLSLIGRESEFERVYGILGLYRSKAEMNLNIKALIKKMKKGDLKEHEYNMVMKTLQEAKDEINNQIDDMEMELEKMVKLNKKYQKELAL